MRGDLTIAFDQSTTQTGDGKLVVKPRDTCRAPYCLSVCLFVCLFFCLYVCFRIPMLVKQSTGII